jgi:hypothetical protein
LKNYQVSLKFVPSLDGKKRLSTLRGKFGRIRKFDPVRKIELLVDKYYPVIPLTLVQNINRSRINKTFSLTTGMTTVFGGTLIIVFLLSQACSAEVIYTLPNTTQTSSSCNNTECGTLACPCLGLLAAINQGSLNVSSSNPITLYLLPGIYTGASNTNLNLSYSLTIM